MITHEQYLRYRALCDEYERALWGTDDGDDSGHVDDDDNLEYDSRLNCRCGAWKLGPKGLMHVADCCCGAE